MSNKGNEDGSNETSFHFDSIAMNVKAFDEEFVLWLLGKIAAFYSQIFAANRVNIWHIPRILDKRVFVLQIQVEPIVNGQNQILTNSSKISKEPKRTVTYNLLFWWNLIQTEFCILFWA